MSEVEKPKPGPVGSGKIVRRPPPGSRRAGGAKKSKRQGPFVQYVGQASHRTISAQDWASIPGMAPPKGREYADSTWDLANDRILECAQFSDEQLDYLLLDDIQPTGGQSFLEVDYNEDGVLVQVVDEE